MNKSTPKSLRCITTTVDGVQVKIDPSQIRPEDRVVHHGTFNGEPVNSMASRAIAGHRVLWDASGRNYIIVKEAEAQVFADQLISARSTNTSGKTGLSSDKAS